jgi:hypothetical protein
LAIVLEMGDPMATPLSGWYLKGKIVLS